MKRTLLLLFLVLPCGCSYHDTFALKPGERLILSNDSVRELSWQSDYPVTVTGEGCGRIENESQGTINCGKPTAILFQDSRPAMLWFARTNYVHLTYPMFTPR